MLLSGVAVDIACFTADPAQFCDRFSFFSELEKLSLPPWSFSAEIGLREAFANQPVLCAAVSAFRHLMLVPRLFTTGAHFTDRQATVSRLEEVADAGVQQIILRVNDAEAAALPSHSVRHLVEGCHAGGIDLRLQLETGDAFTEDTLRIARTVEDRQFTVTLVPIRSRPARRLALADAPPLPPQERIQIVIGPDGDLVLRQQTPYSETLDILAGSLRQQPLRALLAPAQARL